VVHGRRGPRGLDVPGETFYEAPAAPDAIHRGRSYHVETGSTTFIVTLVQPFALFADGAIDVSDATVELTWRNHEVVGSADAVWMNPDEVSQLVKFLTKTSAAVMSGTHLPTGGGR
jgi:hypothetical protein